MANKGTVGDRFNTPEGRVSFPQVFSPETEGQYASGKYKMTLLIPKNAPEIKDMQKRVLTVAKEAFGSATKLKDIQHPFNDGDAKYEKKMGKAKTKEEKEEVEVNFANLKGCYCVNLKSKNKPKIVDQEVQEILSQEEFYAGCWARASVTPYSYAAGGDDGVSFWLGNVQKTKEDDAFGGSGGAVAAEDDFGVVGSTDDDSTEEDDDDYGL